MPKEKKAKSTVVLRHDPLGKQIVMDKEAVVVQKKKEVEKKKKDMRLLKSGTSRGGRRNKDDDDDDEEEDDDAYLTPSMTNKILEEARLQREEVEGKAKNKQSFYADMASDGEDDNDDSSGVKSKSHDHDDEEDDDDDEEEHHGDTEEEDEEEEEEEELVIEEGGYVGSMPLSSSEEALVSSFMGGGTRRNLADIIMEKIREKEEAAMRDETGGAGSGDGEHEPPPLPPKVIQVYTEIGKLLNRYTAGKLPKAFKIIPSLTNWEEVLWLTRPDQWSAHAMFAATKIFSSNFNPKMAQRFYNVFLLERCRDDVAANGRLNYHLYEALMKSVYKPAAFYKGVLLALAGSGNCSLREATIFGSVLARVSIPANHSAVALLKLAELKYSGATSLFIKVLLNKKYSLPFKVIDALVKHFASFAKETRQLPVLWHQSFLAFAQRYKQDIAAADKERLKEVLKVQHHHLITAEIRRELFNSCSRGEAKLAATLAGKRGGGGGDDDVQPMTI